MEHFSKYVFKMVNILRFAGKKLDCPYTVGEHSYRVACLSMAIVDEYNIHEDKENHISMEEVLRKSLLHDLEETITGDIPSPVKQYGNLKKELRIASEQIMKEIILPNSPRPELYLKLWIEDKENETGEVITVSDKLEGLLTCYYEVKRGNRYLDSPLKKHMDWFQTPEARRLLDKYSYAMTEYIAVENYLQSEEVIGTFWGRKFKALFDSVSSIGSKKAS